MRLDDLCTALAALPFPSLGEAAHPARETVLAARAHVGAAVVDREFLVDGLARELDRLAARSPLAGLAPFHVLPDSGIRLAFGYWPPGATAGAHEHTAWTITAVCHNRLAVRTFDRDATYRTGALVAKHDFAAEAGRTGFIYEPCIHEPANPSGAWSLSLHVTSPRDGERDGLEPLPACLAREAAAPSASPYDRVRDERTRARFRGALATVAASLGPDAARIRARLAAADEPLLARTEPGIALGCAPGMHADDVRLVARVADRAITELTIDRAAGAALAFAIERSVVDVRDLPGDLAPAERRAIGDALAATGHFYRLPREAA